MFMLKGVARFYQAKKRHVITTQTEHKCVLDSCRVLEAEGFDVTYLPVQKNGLVDLEVHIWWGNALIMFRQCSIVSVVIQECVYVFRCWRLPFALTLLWYQWWPWTMRSESNSPSLRLVSLSTFISKSIFIKLIWPCGAISTVMQFISTCMIGFFLCWKVTLSSFISHLQVAFVVQRESSFTRMLPRLLERFQSMSLTGRLIWCL